MWKLNTCTFEWYPHQPWLIFIWVAKITSFKIRFFCVCLQPIKSPFHENIIKTVYFCQLVWFIRFLWIYRCIDITSSVNIKPAWTSYLWVCRTHGGPTTRNPQMAITYQSLCIISQPSVNSNLELQSGNAQSGSNSTIFKAVRPWNLTDDLAKQ